MRLIAPNSHWNEYNILFIHENGVHVNKYNLLVYLPSIPVKPYIKGKNWEYMVVKPREW